MTELSQDEPRDDNCPDCAKKRRTSFADSESALWDELAEVRLWREALEELDRRNSSRGALLASETTTQPPPIDLARFARRGGPELSYLRGLSRPTSTTTTQTTEYHTNMAETNISPYETKFEMTLFKHGVFMPQSSRVALHPSVLTKIQSYLGRRRNSVSAIGERVFIEFRSALEAAYNEQDVVDDVAAPFICGSRRKGIYTRRNLHMSGFAKVVPGTTIPEPDLVDGIDRRLVNTLIQEELTSHIDPTSSNKRKNNDLVLPNFFMEIKGPEGTLEVVQRQACHYGAYGARAMTSLTQFSGRQSAYTGKPWAFTALFCKNSGWLELYAHFMVAPAEKGKGPEYHMMLISSHSLILTLDGYKEGVNALRNLRDLAKGIRFELLHDIQGEIVEKS